MANRSSRRPGVGGTAWSCRTTPSKGQMAGGRQPLLQVVADYKRLSAALTAGCAGYERPSGPQYPGVAEDCYRGQFVFYCQLNSLR
jgi:hypothetical protein